MFGKKIPKKVAAVAIAAVLSVLGCTPALADYTYEIGWDDRPCPRCGEDAAIWIQEVHKNASAVGQHLCTHNHRFGVDIEYEKRIITNYDCHECYISWSEEEYIYFEECQGRDKP